MYASVDFNDMAEDERAIRKIIMGTNVFRGPYSILAKILERVTRLVAETMAMFNAVMDAGLFFLGGAKAHCYDIGPATGPARAAAAMASSTARLAAAKVSAYLRRVETPTTLAVQFPLDALFARVTIAEALKVDRMADRPLAQQPRQPGPSHTGH